LFVTLLPWSYHKMSKLIVIISIALFCICLSQAIKMPQPNAHFGRTANVQPQLKWMEFLNKDATEVKNTLKATHPNLDVVIVQQGSASTSDIRTDRVRLFVDENNIVKTVPFVG